MKKDLIVTLADNNYIEQAKQLFASVYFNANWPGDYMLLAYDISENDLDWFKSKGIKITKCEKIPNNIKGDWSDVILCKLYLFTPEFKKWNRVIYMDSDIIVRHPLSAILEVKELAAVSDSFLRNKIIDQFIRPQEINQEKFKKIKTEFDIEAKSFNSGFFIFNTAIIKNHTFADLKKILYKYQNIFKPWNGDQPVLNIYFNKKWQELPLIYNLDYRDFKHLNHKHLNPVILHFNEDDKPWIKTNPFYNEWLNNLNKSDEIDLKSSPQNMNKKKPLSRVMILRIMFYLSFKNIIKLMDRKLGMGGRYLYYHYPHFYHKLIFFKKWTR